MKYSYIKFSIGRCLPLVLLLFLALTVQSQVGIGNTNPDPSSALDITSTTQGLLAPRMTTLQRNAIATPADGLLVYDKNLKSFYYFNETPSPGTWIKINASTNQRDNYKLVKSAADLADEFDGSKYTLQSDFLYEINGQINLAGPIDLNNAYVSGLDANQDILTRASGPIFQGNTGGSIRNITLTGGGSAFAITGGTSLLIQNTIIANFASVGTISNVGFYFGSVMQFVNNTTGINYNNIDDLLLNNQAWLEDNEGIFEKFTGSFVQIQKASGFSIANGTAVAIDVSGNPTVGSGVITGTVFSGTSNKYVEKYTTGSYTAYNFTNSWTVNAPGIPKEDDDVATANLYYNNSAIVTINNANAFKLPVNTTSIRLFRTNERAGGDRNNSIVYSGRKKRAINVFGSISFTATANSRYTFSIRKNASLVSGTESIFDVLQTNQRQTVSIIGTVDVNPNDYIEIYVQKTTLGSEEFLVTAYNLIVN